LPAEHGPVLYLLSQLEQAHYGSVAWKDFGRLFGAPADARDFGSFLDQSDHAFWNAHEVWDTLSPGWSRAAVLLERLDAYIDRQRSRSAVPEANDALGRIVTRMCAARQTVDLAQLHAWADRCAAVHASDQRDLEPIAFRTTPGKCAEP
jgi:hypothetical protein